MAKRLLAVIESQWFANGISARPFFDVLSDAKLNRGQVLYERFVNKASLEEVLKFVVKKRVQLIYIGSHCTKSRLDCPNGDKVEVRRVRDVILKQSEAVGGRVSGLFLSGCYIATEKNAAAILDHPESRHSIRWVAGFGGGPDWFPSSAFEALFFSEFFDEPGWDLETIKNVAKRFVRSKNTFSKQFGFNIFVRKPGNAKGIVNLTAA